MTANLRGLFWVSLVCLAANTAFGQTGAKKDGDWSDPSIWTGGIAPGSGDSVYIGSNSPSGAASNAAVRLSANQSAKDLYVGYGPGTSGTLDLGGYNLTVGNQLYIGYNGGSGTVTRGSGSLTTQGLSLDSGSTFAFGVHDVVSCLFLTNGSRADTAATSNIRDGVWLVGASQITLGADMFLNVCFDAGQYGPPLSRMTLDMDGHSLTANRIGLGGLQTGSSVTIKNRGSLRATELGVYNAVFDFIPADRVTIFHTSNGTCKTVATENIAGNVVLEAGSQLTLGANMRLDGHFWAGANEWFFGTATLDMDGHSLSADSIRLGNINAGTSATIHNRGAVYATEMRVDNGTFDFTPADRVGAYNLQEATTRTAATSNITRSVYVHADWSWKGSSLTLGADMALERAFSLTGFGAKTLDMEGHSLTADAIGLGICDSLTIKNRGSLYGKELNVDFVWGGQFDLTAADQVASFSLSQGTTKTAVTTNIMDNISLNRSSTLIMGADMSLTGNLHAQDKSIVDAARHCISANAIHLGYGISTSGLLLNGGAISVNNLRLDNGSAATFYDGGTINSTISLSNSSVVKLFQAEGNRSGLTLNGVLPGSLSLDDTSRLMLISANTDPSSWIFRWKDHNDGNWMDTLSTLIDRGRITTNAPSGYRLYDSGGYTYLGITVPVPATPVGLFQLGGIAAAVVLWRRRQRT